jgi:hypothetical protein
MVVPVVLNRIGMHTALTTQWMILCALWLYFSSRELQARRWLLLLLFAVSVHAYLFVMVAGLWAAHLAKCGLARALGWRQLGLIATTLVAVVAWMHCIGYFIVGTGAAAGGDMTRFDLVNFVVGTSWNTILPTIYGNLEQNAWDGYAYLGTGLMGLLVAGVVVLIVRRALGMAPPEASRPVVVSWIPLVVVACGFVMYAASNHVLFNGHQIFHYPWPWWLRTIAATFRGAGRMIWPTYYILVLAILWFAIRAWPPRVLGWILAGCLAVQVVDFREGARLMRVGVSGSGDLIKPLNDPIWTMIAARYHKLVSIPAFHGQPDRFTLGWFAARNGIATNIGYFSRMNPRVQEQGAQRALDEMLGGAYDPDTAYYFPYPEIWNIARLTASASDLAVIVDGHHLLLPGGAPAGTEKPPTDIIVPPLGTWLSFGIDGAASGYLLDGWSWHETWGTWSNAKTARLIVPIPRGHRGKLQVSLRWLGHTAPRGKQQIHILFEQTEFQVWFNADAVQQEDSFEVVPTHDWISVRVRIRQPIVASDGRALGLGLMAIRLSEPEAR